MHQMANWASARDVALFIVKGYPSASRSAPWAGARMNATHPRSGTTETLSPEPACHGLCRMSVTRVRVGLEGGPEASMTE